MDVTTTMRPGYTPMRNQDSGSRGVLMPALVGVGTGVAAGAITRNMVGAFSSMPAGRVLAIAVAAGAAVGGAAAGLTALVRARAERMPAPSDPSTAPRLDRPAVLPEPRTDASPRERRIGTSYESDWECTTDSDGDRDCRWETDYDPIRIIEGIGDRNGYASVKDAIAATQHNTGVAVLREDGRYQPYLTEGLGSMDYAIDVDSDVAALVSPSGSVYSERTRHESLHYVERRSRASIPVDTWEQIGRLALHKELDGKLRSDGAVSDIRGFEERADAVGDALARPGSHAVIRDGDRFHVVRVETSGDDHDARLDGVLRRSDAVEAIEYRGQALVPHGPYFVVPND